MVKRFLKYFTKLEWIMWITSVIIVTVGFAVADNRSVLSYLSSLAGVTCIIINAKGNVAGQFVSIAFGILYGVYAYTQRYFGEMLIYFFLMVPIHVVSIFTWLRNKYDGKAHEVKINVLKRIEYVFVTFGAAAATVAFYFLLRLLKTDNLIVSTVSLTTSITAAYLMLRRCEYFSLCFIFNDAVLIALWSMKFPTQGLSVLPSVMTFCIFLIIDAYCYISWRQMRKRQTLNPTLADLQEENKQQNENNPTE